MPTEKAKAIAAKGVIPKEIVWTFAPAASKTAMSW